MRLLLLASLLVGCTTAPATSTADCGTNIADGALSFIQAYFACVDSTNNRIQSDGLPPHESPYWGEGHELYVAFDARDGDYRQNPNEIGTTNLDFTLADDPTPQAGLTITEALIDTTMNTSNYEYSGGPVGVAANGVSMFAAMAAPGDDIYEERFTFDRYEGHPAGTTYHYHSHTPGPLEVMVDKGLSASSTPGEGDVEVYGLMCDGTVVLGCTELDGSAPDEADLDAQNGHVHDLDDGNTVHFAERYHTHVCTALGGFELFPEIAFYETTGC